MKAVTWRGRQRGRGRGRPGADDPQRPRHHPRGRAVARPAARTCTCWAATSPPCAPVTCSATSSWARWPRSARACTKHKVGDRVVVVSFTSCGQCWYCKQELWSLCDNGNPNPAITEALWGQSIGGCYGYSHAMGGWAGSHAHYMRVPYADQGAFAIPDGVSDERALFASDAAPTGWTGAHLAGSSPATSSRCGAPAASGRWPRARRCSWAPSGSSSSTGYDNRLAAGPHAHRGGDPRLRGGRRRRGAAGDVRRPRSGRLHRGGGHGGAQHRPAVPLRPGQAAVAAAVRPADRPPGGHLRLPQGRHGVRAGRVRRPGGQVPARRGDEQGADPARRPAARAPLHPG